MNPTDYRMNMRPSDMLALKRDTVERSLQTIENRINALGLTEPIVQQEGSAERGLPDRGAAAGRRRSGAREGYHGDGRGTRNRRGERRPLSEPRRGARQHGGVLPLNTKLVEMAASGTEAWR